MAPDIEGMNISRPNVKMGPFNGCLVSYSQLPESANKKKLKKIIKKFGGLNENILLSTVTHLITMDWFTNKSLVIRQRRMKKPVVMMPKWIEAVASQTGAEVLPATHPSFLIHRLPIFYGFTLCFSQVSLEKRAMLKQKVERNGGKYSGIFDPSVVTHLILVAPEGKKYETAMKFNEIKKVNASWFTDSLKYGIPLLEKDYPAIYMEETSYSQNIQDTSVNKRKSGDSFPNMAEFLSCKKTKSNLFNNLTIRRQRPLAITSPPKQAHNLSMVKADEFESILKDLNNIEQENRRNNGSSKPVQSSSQNGRRPQKLELTKIQSSQLSDKITESLPVLWEGSA